MLMAPRTLLSFDTIRGEPREKVKLFYDLSLYSARPTIMQTASHPCTEKHEIANFAWPRCNNFIALRQRIVIQLTKFLGQWNGVVVCDQTPRRLIALRPLRIRFCFVWKQISVKLSVRFLILILFCTNRLCTTRFYHCLIVILGQI